MIPDALIAHLATLNTYNLSRTRSCRQLLKQLLDRKFCLRLPQTCSPRQAHGQATGADVAHNATRPQAVHMGI